MARLRRIGAIGALAALLIGVLAVPGATPATLDFRLYRAVQAYVFNPVAWMAGALGDRARVALASAARPGSASADVRAGDGAGATPAEEVAVVRRYLAAPRRADDALRDEAERILQRQIAASLADLGIEWSVLGEERVFPPVQFEFVALPDVLVVSRRDRIERIFAQTLRGGLTDDEATAIEERVAAEGVSAIVVKIGGLGVYPSMIPPTGSLEWLLPTLAHEWAHQFFTLQPVGWRYALDLERDPRMITLNETAAEMVGEEVGWHALERFYGVQRPEASAQSGAGSGNPQQTEFGRRLRAIRERAEALLAAGQVEEAERFMEAERQRLVADGYRVRRLNQAYFAFYGNYASAPGFVSPIGDQLKALRQRSGSLRAFLFTVASFNSVDDLEAALAGRGLSASGQ